MALLQAEGLLVRIQVTVSWNGVEVFAVLLVLGELDLTQHTRTTALLLLFLLRDLIPSNAAETGVSGIGLGVRFLEAAVAEKEGAFVTTGTFEEETLLGEGPNPAISGARLLSAQLPFLGSPTTNAQVPTPELSPAERGAVHSLSSGAPLRTMNEMQAGERTGINN